MVPSSKPLDWFPLPWRPLVGLLLSLRRGPDPRMLEDLMRGRICREDSDGVCRRAPDWYSLLKALASKEPVLNVAGIHMRPRLVQIPCHAQKSLLTLLERHKSELPLNMLQQFVATAEDHVTDDWCKLYLHLLHIHIINAYSVQSEEFIDGGFVSQSSMKMFDSLCEQIKRDESSQSTQQIGSDWLKDTQATQIRHPDWPESASHSQRTASAPSRKRKISEGNVCDVDKPAMKPSEKRLRLEMSVEDIFPTGGADELRGETDELRGETELGIEKSLEAPEGANAEKSPTADVWKERLEATYSPLQEVIQSARGSLTPVEADLLNALVALPSAEVEIVCNAVSMDSLNLNLLAVVCQLLVAMPANHISFTTTKVLAKCLFSRKVTDLNQAAPRGLVLTLCQFAQSYPRALMDGCIIPYLQGGTMGSHQGDLILKIAKESLDNDGQLSLLRALILTKKIEWSDHTTIFLQGIFKTKIFLPADVLDELLTFLDVHHAAQSKCPKFAKLLVAIINKSQKQLGAAHKTVILGIINNNQTFLKKTLTAALKKCS